MNIAKAAHVWDRSDNEWYVEPSDCTLALLTVEKFSRPIWDPSCGGGNIIKACLARGLRAVGTDIVNRGWDVADPAFGGELDFLSTDRLRGPNIIMNPPFDRGRMTEAFIRHALALGAEKVAAFVDVRFLLSAKRASGLYAELPPSRIWIIAPRPSCPPGAYLEAGNKAGGGTADYCWLVWDRTHPSTPTITGWLKRIPA